MGRLTKRGVISQRDIDELMEYSNENQFGRNDAYFKLQHYEDLGFTPEEIAYMAKFYKEQTSVAAITADLKIAGALAELDKYKKAEEQGLLLKLPCKIGDDVYIIPSKVNYDLNVLSKHEENNRVYHQKVARIVFTKDGWYMEGHADMEFGTGSILSDVFLGETWFLVKEEAEKALEEMRERNER